MKYESFLFDIGNVLVPIDISKVEPFFLENCENVPAEELTGQIRVLCTALESGEIDGEAFLQRLRDDLGFHATREQFLGVWNSIFSDHQGMWKLVSKLKEGGARLYLFSNTNDFHLDHLLEKYTVFQHFDDGIFSQKIGFMKPNEGFYRSSLELLPIDPARTIYIDDLAANVDAGRDFGFECIQYDHSDHDRLIEQLRNLGLQV
jgi:epoxide hydrolase-like predicted phosphatase